MKQQGFSLLELSIVLTILAIVVAGGLTLGTAKVQQDEISRTYDKMTEIETALRVFLNEYDRLPCPASLTLTRTNALYGREATDCSDASPPAGLTRVEYPAASGQYVRIGGVPFYSLHLPEKYLMDEWGNRFLYAVQETAITSLSSTSTGNIRVVDNAGTSISDEIVSVLVSHGRSHKGAYSARAGTLITACDATNKDRENCDADGIFTDAVFNDGDVAANFYDDMIKWNTRMRLFDTVSVSGAFKPWDSGFGRSASDYPLEIKGVTGSTYAGNLGIAAYNTACDAAYDGSWMLRSGDLPYIDDIPVVASPSRIHVNVCTGDTGDTGASASYCFLLPSVRLLHPGSISGTSYTNNSLQEMNCNNWASNSAVYAQVAISRATTTGIDFRDVAITTGDNATFTNQSNTNTTDGFRVVTSDCSTSLPLLCVGER